MKQLIQTEAFKKEMARMPLESREDIFSTVYQYLGLIYEREKINPSVAGRSGKGLGYRLPDFLNQVRIN